MREEDTLEVEEALPEQSERGFTPAGIYGDMDAKAVTDRIRRIESFKQKKNYHETVTCDGCCNSLEIRKFNKAGEIEVVGFYCFMAECVVSQYGTCDSGHLRNNRRKRVIYDLENAPIGFEQGQTNVPMRRFYTKKEESQAREREAQEGYRGGSKFYVRADGGDVGSGKIPKSLGN